MQTEHTHTFTNRKSDPSSPRLSCRSRIKKDILTDSHTKSLTLFRFMFISQIYCHHTSDTIYTLHTHIYYVYISRIIKRSGRSLNKNERRKMKKRDWEKKKRKKKQFSVKEFPIEFIRFPALLIFLFHFGAQCDSIFLLLLLLSFATLSLLSLISFNSK